MENLSELQISLVAIGVLVILGVVCFNWMQQRRYRQRVEKAFGAQHDDVLLGGNISALDTERIEPRLDMASTDDSQAFSDEEPDNEEPDILPENAEPEPGTQAEPGAKTETGAQAEAGAQAETGTESESRLPDVTAEQKPIPSRGVRGQGTDTNGVDYVVDIRSETLIADIGLTEIVQRKFDFGKPVYWTGQRNVDAFWNEITAENQSSRGGYVNLRGCLQLADRAGPVSEVSLSEFRDMVENFSARVNAAADCPDVQEAYGRAVLLDEFCAEVDVMVGINIVSKDSSIFTGAKVHVLAEASGFKLGTDGLFHYRDENNIPLFSLGNHESSPFLPGSIRTLTTHGVTFLLDVPRIADGERVFGQMMHLAEAFADTLGGTIVDDNGVSLNDDGIRKIRHQVSAIQSLMLARGIPAGGEIALRLFA